MGIFSRKKQKKKSYSASPEDGPLLPGVSERLLEGVALPPPSSVIMRRHSKHVPDELPPYPEKTSESVWTIEDWVTAQVVDRRVIKARLSHPILLDPIRSYPIRSNPIQSNPIRLFNPIQPNPTRSDPIRSAPIHSLRIHPHPLPSQPVPSHSLPSHALPSHPLPSHPLHFPSHPSDKGHRCRTDQASCARESRPR